MDGDRPEGPAACRYAAAASDRALSRQDAREGIEEHRIEGVTVRIYNVAKTVVDLFRYRQSAGKRYKKSPGLNLALEGLREALRQRKATPAEIAEYATTRESGKSSSPTFKR